MSWHWSSAGSRGFTTTTRIANAVVVQKKDAMAMETPTTSSPTAPRKKHSSDKYDSSKHKDKCEYTSSKHKSKGGFNKEALKKIYLKKAKA